MSLAFLFHYLTFNMFRMLIHPSLFPENAARNSLVKVLLCSIIINVMNLLFIGPCIILIVE
jgi:hypothetical protein